MRFEVINKNLTFEEGKIGEVQRVKSLTIQTQTLSPPYDVIRGEFYIEAEELQEYINEGMTYDDIAELKLKALLEVDVTPIDAHAVESIERNAAGAIASVRDALEEIDVAKAEIKASAKKDVEDAKELIKEEVQEELRVQIEKVKNQLRNVVKIVDIAPDELKELIELYEPWKENENVKKGDIRHHEGKLYEVVQDHTTQSDWTPNATPALWKEVAPEVTEEGEEIIPEFVQPTGAHDAYKKGDKVIFKDNVYESLIDGNAHSPEVYAQGWKLVE